MIVVPQAPAPNSEVGKTLSFIALGLTIAVGIGTMIYLRHQIKLVKLQVDNHEKLKSAHGSDKA